MNTNLKSVFLLSQAKDKKTPYALAKENKHDAVASYLADEMKKRNIPVPEEKGCIIQ